jgi:hypothetical protein
MWRAFDSGGLWPQGRDGLVGRGRIRTSTLYREGSQEGSSLNANEYNRTAFNGLADYTLYTTLSWWRTNGRPATWCRKATFKNEEENASQIAARGACRLRMANKALKLNNKV